MWITTALLVAAAMPVQQQQTDTLISVRPGTKLEIENYGGETVIGTWDRSAIRIQAEHGLRDRVEIRNVGSVVTVKSESRMGPPHAIDYRITVPVKTDLSVSGVYQDVSVDGVQGSVEVSTVNGDVTLTGGDGFVSLKSVEGDVRVSGANAKIVVESVNADVRVESSTGDIEATTVNGDVELLGVTSAVATANTVNGDIKFDGPIQDAGRYDFSTNNGDITASVPETANATVSVETFSGEFESTYPVKLTQSRKNRFTFVLGNGSGRINLESFQGTIRIAKPGELRRGTGSGSGSGRGRSRNRNNDNHNNDYNYNYRYDSDVDVDVDFDFDFKHAFKFDFGRDIQIQMNDALERDLKDLKNDLKRQFKDFDQDDDRDNDRDHRGGA